jgi:hypothetical protein
MMIRDVIADVEEEKDDVDVEPSREMEVCINIYEYMNMYIHQISLNTYAYIYK